MRKIIMASITAVVVIAVLAGTLIPVLDDATATTDTFTNEGLYRMEKITATDSETHTMEWVKSTDTFTVDGTIIDMGDTSTYSGVSVAILDTGLFRYQPGVRIQSWSTGVGGSQGYSAIALEIVFSGGTANITYTEADNTESTSTRSYEWAYILSNDGPYIMKGSSDRSYTNADSEILGMGLTNLASGDTTVLSILKMDGTPETVDFSAIYVNGDASVTNPPTFSNVNIDKNTVSNYVDLYQIGGVTATATLNDTDTSISYTWFVVPYEVSAERAVHFTDGENAIFNAIPVIVIVALLLAVVALVLRSRME